MANHNIKEPKEYTEGIRKFETTDKAHADVFNKVIESLVNNDAYANEHLEKIEAPEYAESSAIEELSSGESIFKALGKIKKAVCELISHIKKSATASTAGHVKLAYHEDVIEPGTYALDAVQANCMVQGTLAHQVLKDNIELTKKLSGDNISSSSAVTDKGMYVLDAVEKNASVAGTLANQIAAQNTNLGQTTREIENLKYIIQAEIIGWRAAIIKAGGWGDFGGSTNVACIPPAGDNELYIVKFNNGAMYLVKSRASAQYSIIYQRRLSDTDVMVGPSAPTINDTVGSRAFDNNASAYTHGSGHPIAISKNAGVKAWYAPLNGFVG